VSAPRSSRFGALAQAVKDRAGAAEVPEEREVGTVATAPVAPALVRPLTNAGVHGPSAALGNLAEGLRERVARLEADLARTNGRNADLERELERARKAASAAGDSVEDFLFLDPLTVRDELPRDRLPGAFAGPEFDELLADIRDNGQNDAITVRPSPSLDGGFEVADMDDFIKTQTELEVIPPNTDWREGQQRRGNQRSGPSGRFQNH